MSTLFGVVLYFVCDLWYKRYGGRYNCTQNKQRYNIRSKTWHHRWYNLYRNCYNQNSSHTRQYFMGMDYHNRRYQTIQHFVWIYPISQTYIDTYHTKQSYGSDTLHHPRSATISRTKILNIHHLSSYPTISHPRRSSHPKRTHDNIINFARRQQSRALQQDSHNRGFERRSRRADTL